MIHAQTAVPSLFQLATTLQGQDYRCDDATGQPSPIDNLVVCEVWVESLADVEADADYFVLWSEEIDEP